MNVPRTFTSPWLDELRRTRPVARLRHGMDGDVAVVGAGIAGVATAYHLLRDTDRTVMLIEAGSVGHAATGHSAGQVASYFERSFASMVERLGVARATALQAAVESAWTLLQRTVDEAGLRTYFSSFAGHAGCLNERELLARLRDRLSASRAGIFSEQIRIASDWPGLGRLPPEFRGLFMVVSRREILASLETRDARYFATISGVRGCMNAAAFSEELVAHMLAKYPRRFRLAEDAPIERIELRRDSAVLHERQGRTLRARRVVLCTNGFEHVDLVNLAGPPISKRFRRAVYGVIGYMLAFYERRGRPPAAISYLRSPSHPEYFYMTRRPFVDHAGRPHTLVSVGGPEVIIQNTRLYRPAEHVFPKVMRQRLDAFIRRTYDRTLRARSDYAFQWHGLMGYTPRGLRMVGFEPRNRVLLYNLGCNGVGILPSVYGAHRIALALGGQKLEPSAFDPR